MKSSNPINPLKHTSNPNLRPKVRQKDQTERGSRETDQLQDSRDQMHPDLIKRDLEKICKF
jgi:hypothetical protein